MTPTSRKLWARAYRCLFRRWPQRVVDERMAQVAAWQDWYDQEARLVEFGVPCAPIAWDDLSPSIRDAFVRLHLRR